MAPEPVEDACEILVQSINGGILITDVSAAGAAVVVRVNEALCELLGYSQEELSRLPFSEWLLSPQGSLAQDAARATSFPPGFTEDTPLRHRDGRSIPVQISTRVFNHRGRAMALSVIHDISERRAETAALRDASARKDEFLATLAHELRNPLAPLRHGVDILSQPDLSPDLLNQTRAMMGRQLTQIVRLIDDLLDVSRISQGKLELRRTPTLVSTVVASATEMTKPILLRKAQNLITHLPVEDVWVDADPGRLIQILANLLENAAKFSTARTNITLTVRVDASQVILVVEDQGVGMSAEFLARAFELFSQGDRVLERSHGGLGIGLYLVKTLVDMHGGSVSASSAGRGQGSMLAVRLPVVTPAPPAPREPASVVQVPSVRTRVLVADDNTDAASMLAGLLAQLGSDVRTAFDGHSALALATEFQPEVVLLDIEMPIMNGYEVCRRLRLAASGKPPVLIAVTGFGQPEDRRHVREAGFDHHLIKPIDFDALASLLASLPRPPGALTS